MNMVWGFTEKPATLEDLKGCVGPGWGKIIEDLVTKLESLGWDGVVMQVKEKFGGLRFYIGSGTPEMYDAIREAEEHSLETCEDCGAAGELVDDEWVRTLCRNCAKLWLNKLSGGR